MKAGPWLCSKPCGVGDAVYMLESACVKIVWQREFLLQEVKV
jgi:hypothetical protein